MRKGIISRLVSTYREKKRMNEEEKKVWYRRMVGKYSRIKNQMLVIRDTIESEKDTIERRRNEEMSMVAEGMDDHTPLLSVFNQLQEVEDTYFIDFERLDQKWRTVLSKKEKELEDIRFKVLSTYIKPVLHANRSHIERRAEIPSDELAHMIRDHPEIDIPVSPKPTVLKDLSFEQQKDLKLQLGLIFSDMMERWISQYGYTDAEMRRFSPFLSDMSDPDQQYRIVHGKGIDPHFDFWRDLAKKFGLL